MDVFDRLIRLVNTIWRPVFYALVILACSLMGLFAFMGWFGVFYIFGTEPPKGSVFWIWYPVAMFCAIKVGEGIGESRDDLAKIIGAPDET